MPRFYRLRPAGLLAALTGVVAVACGTDYIELLPSSAGASVGTVGNAGNAGQGAAGAGGKEVTAGSASGGAPPAGMGGRPSGGDAGSAGSLPSGGRAGGPYGCVGAGCAGLGGEGGQAEPACPDPSAPWCTPCSDNTDCKAPFRCNGRLSMCLPGCETSLECNKEGFVCDPLYGTCGACFNDDQCQTDGHPKHHACESSLGRCVECNEREPCTQGMCFNTQCVECTSDKDCTSGRRCDKIRGRCI